MLEYVQNYWEIILLILALIIFKIFVLKKERDLALKNRKSRNEELKNIRIQSTLNLKILTKKHFEEKRYSCILENFEDNRDITFIFKENKYIFVFCNAILRKNAISENDLKLFHSNCFKYIDENSIKKDDVELIYAIKDKKILSLEAKNILNDSYYKCSYLVLKNNAS